MTCVWIINHYAGGPGIGTGWRHWELARRWIQSGGRVRVFTASTSIGGSVREERDGRRDVLGVPFHFVRTPAYGGNGLGRLRNIVAFNRRVQPTMRQVMRMNDERPDVILTSSPQPLVWPAAARFAQSIGAAFVPEIRDLWPESLLQLGGLPGWHPLVTWCRWADKAAMRAATLVFSPLGDVRAAIRARGHARLRCVHVPNGVSLEGTSPPAMEADLQSWIDGARSSGRRIVLYAGALGVPNAMDQLLEALNELSIEQRDRLLVLLVGEGTERDRLALRAREAGLPLQFAGPRTQPQVRALCRACDAGFLGWLNRPLYRFGIAPQKRGLMLGEGLPLLHAVPHDQVDETALGTGWSVPAGDAKALAAAIRDFLETPADRLQAMRARCRSYAHEHFDWDRIASKAWGELQELDIRRRD
jgi:glycosyltransferase involved in cell wall biosynthesis